MNLCIETIYNQQDVYEWASTGKKCMTTLQGFVRPWHSQCDHSEIFIRTQIYFKHGYLQKEMTIITNMSTQLHDVLCELLYLENKDGRTASVLMLTPCPLFAILSSTKAIEFDRHFSFQRFTGERLFHFCSVNPKGKTTEACEG